MTSHPVTVRMPIYMALAVRMAMTVDVPERLCVHVRMCRNSIMLVRTHVHACVRAVAVHVWLCV